MLIILPLLLTVYTLRMFRCDSHNPIFACYIQTSPLD